MNKPRGRAEYLSSKVIFKGVIRFLLFRYGELTAKQIQARTGLKRQTTYNYLKELTEEEKINVRYDKVENQPNVNVAYYSIRRKPLPGEESVLLSERIKMESKTPEIMIERIRDTIDTNLGALLEIQTAFDRMTNEEVMEFLGCDPVAWGFYGFTYLLTEAEYSELQIEFKKLIDRLDKKWNSEKQDRYMHSGNVFTFTFYRTISE